MLKYTAIAVALLCALSVNAEARQRHKATGLHPECGISMPCVAPYASSPEQARVTRGRYIARQMGFGTAREARPARHSARPHHRTVSRYSAPAPSLTWAATTLVDRAKTYVAPQILPHPENCPRVAFCGCGAAVRVFGRPIRDLWLAANWLRFPRTSPAPGMVAARRGHVFVLERHIGGSTWLAWDANSGRRQTRIHARSISGFAIVNPRGGSA